MKRISALLFLSIFLTLSIFGQSLKMYESKYYRLFTDMDKTSAEDLTPIMDSYLNLFNKYLHFDTKNLPLRLKVRLYQNKADYDKYLKSVISETSNSYVFLQYKDSGKNELVAYILSNEEKMKKDLIHYGFIQYFKAFIPYPPLWIMNGFAVYFENCSYSMESKNVSFKENYDWIPTLRKVIQDRKTIPIDTILTIDLANANKTINSFYAQTWGLIDFLLNTSYPDYNRILWDALSSLSKTATRQENGAAVITKAFSWVNKKTFVSDFISYVGTLKTYNDLLNDGISAYSQGNYESAEKNFIAALSINKLKEIPYYYLGLINYARSDYSMAEHYYNTALQISTDKDRVYYALAVNAFADKRFEDVKFYLKSISSAGTKTYKDKINDLTSRMGKIKTGS